MAKDRGLNLVKSQVIYKDYSKDAERTALVSGENLSHMFGKIARWYTDISWVGHTHTEANITDFGTYAGASTKGGAATSANKLNIGSVDIGSETKPVYFSYLTGKPVACTYSLNASVPANAVFTDINVKQSPSTADESREVLFAGNTGNTETTGTVGKSNKLYFNPNTGALTATSFSGSLAASNLTGTIDAGRLPTTAVTAGSYGPAAGGTLAHGGTFDVGYVTVDKYGRLTGASTKTFTLPAQYVHPSYTSKTSGLYKITVDGTGHVSGTAAVTGTDLPSHTHPYIPLSGSMSITGKLRETMGETAGAEMSVSNGTYIIGLHVGTGGVNHGIYDFTPDINQWMCYHNGTENVFLGRATSAGKWTTARTITIGSTGKSVDGSGNISWSLSEIGAAASSHTHNYAGSPTPGGDANRALQSNNCKVDVTNASTSTAYGVVFVKDPETTEDNTLRKTYDFRINHFRGAANTEGITELVLGNNVAKTSINNSSGHISFYNSNGKYTEIVPNTGSSGITITLPSSAGTLALVGDNNHTHNYIPNTQAGLISAINLLSTGESTPTDNDYYIAQFAGGGTTTTSYHRRLHSALWSYINGKISYSNTGSGNAVTSISYSNGVITATKGATFASSTHTHGTLYDSFVTTLDTTTNTWAVAGLNGTGHVIKSIRTNTNAPAYLLNDFSAGIGFGGGDTRGVISVKYNTPIIRFAGGNRTATDGGTATWYFTLSATSAQTYTFPTTGGTLTDIIYKASNYYATASHTHSYLPLAGGTMTGTIAFEGVGSTEYPATSQGISFSGSTDGATIFYEVAASDKGCLVLQTTDDPDAKIVFRNKVTSGGTRANEVTITDGVIAGNGSGLTNLNASNISSGTIAAARLPDAYLPLAGGTMSGLIKGGRGYTHLALGTDSYTNDYAGLDKFNNVDINTWYGFSVSNACTSVGTLNQVVFSVNARTGNVYARTGIYVGSTKVSLEGHTHTYLIDPGKSLYKIEVAWSGNSVPTTETTYPAVFTTYNKTSGTTIRIKETTWTNVKTFLGLGSAAYTASTAYASSSHTHNYAGSSTAGGDANRAVYSNNCATIVTNASSGTNYGIVFVADPGASEDNALRKTYDFRLYHWRGTANTEGITELVLGNSTPKTSDKNSSGMLSIYNGMGYHTDINSALGTANITITLPSTGGNMTNVVYKTGKTLSSVSHSGWTNATTDNAIVPTMSFIAYWNGAYDSSNHSNISYCSRGAFGSIVTHNEGDYLLTSGGTISSGSFGPLVIKRTGSTYAAGIKFYNQNGSTDVLLGAIGMTGSADGGLVRWKSDLNTPYTILDSGNYSSWAMPNSQDGMNAGINKLSTGSSTPVDADYYISQYVNGGTATTSYHRRPHSALFAYINSKLYKILWSGSTSCTARSSTSITLTTAISANKYRFIKVVWNCGTYTGISEFRADTLNVTNNIPSGSDATTTNMIQFKIASDGKSVSVGPGTAAITVIQIAGVYPI